MPFVLILLLLFCNVTFAERMVVTGKPIVIEPHKGHYTLPDSYAHESTKGYHLVQILNVERVCFIHAMAAFQSLDMVRVIIYEPKRKIPWYCYKFDPQFFERDY